MHKTKKKIPATISEAVDYLIAALPLRDRAEIARMEERDLAELHLSSLGLYIRSEFSLWSANKKLMEECRSHAGKPELRGDGISYVIIKELWEKLRKTHLLRIVK